VATRNTKENFETKFVVTPGCWNWIGFINKSGYGRLQWHMKMTLAHRLSYVLYVGPIPDGMFVCHKCDNRKCVNPDHLFIGDHLDNMHDMSLKGRRNPPRLHGERHGNSKLTNDIVLAIRADNRLLNEMAKAYGVSEGCLSEIRNRKTWTHI
jgi:hypothetical protein